MYLRLLLLCLLAVVLGSAQLTGEKRRVGLRYMAAEEEDTPYNYGARSGQRDALTLRLRGRYGKRADPTGFRGQFDY